MKLTKVALAVSTLLMSAGALAHGYVSEPASRDLLCQKGVNKDCGAAQYEPQSVGESPKGFPAAGTPPDGKLVSGNGGSESLGTLLNAQSSDRWAKHKMKAGKKYLQMALYCRPCHSRLEILHHQTGLEPKQTPDP